MFWTPGTLRKRSIPEIGCNPVSKMPGIAETLSQILKINKRRRYRESPFFVELEL